MIKKKMTMTSLNNKLYAVKDVEKRLAEELEDRFELACWMAHVCGIHDLLELA